jgi:hypothetical protein
MNIQINKCRINLCRTSYQHHWFTQTNVQMQIKSNKRIEHWTQHGNIKLNDFDAIDINQHEHMKNALHNINNQQYLSYNHQSKMINEYSLTQH